MKIWLDAQLSPAIAGWMEEVFDLEEVLALQSDSELVSAKDREIFEKAKHADVVVMTKDRDFVDLVDRLGAPPQVLWITCGNTSNHFLRGVLSKAFPRASNLLEAGEALVELSGTE